MIRFLAFLTLVFGTTAMASPRAAPPTVTIVFPEEGETTLGTPTLDIGGSYTPKDLTESISVTVVDANDKVVGTGAAKMLNGVWSFNLADVPTGKGYRAAAYVDNTEPAIFSNVPTFNVK